MTKSMHSNRSTENVIIKHDGHAWPGGGAAEGHIT